MAFSYPIWESELPDKNLELKDTMVLFDRDLGVSIFQNFKGYNDLADDAEWLLERTSQKSRGFIIRPVRKNNHDGLWIGEYDYRGNQINRQEFLFDSKASTLCLMIKNYVLHKVSEKRLLEKLSIESLRKTLKSTIVQDFRFYVCPANRFYRSCVQVDKIYAELIKKYGKGKKVHYFEVAKEIEKAKPCEDVVVCPLMVPNLFERILNLNNALRIRKLGEIRFTSSDNVEIL
jgi:hypothetical protein